MWQWKLLHYPFPHSYSPQQHNHQHKPVVVIIQMAPQLFSESAQANQTRDGLDGTCTTTILVVRIDCSTR